MPKHASLCRTRVLLTLAVLSTISGARAAVILDGTAGPVRPVTGPNFTVTAGDGHVAGTNLYHSFSTLSLANGESLTFTGPSTVTNIITRVTGGQRSQIDGKIDTTNMPSAHFLLINPAGISFGSTAKLSVSKSFTAATADAVRLSDGSVITTTSPLLSSAPPSAFGFTAPHQGTIEVKGSTLTVNRRQALSLVSGSVLITDQASLGAQNGHIQIVAVGDSGTVQIDTSNTGNTAMSAPPSVLSAGLIQIGVKSTLDVDFSGGGRIDILGQQMLIQGTVSAPTSGALPGGALTINAIKDCMIDGGIVATGSNSFKASGPVNIQVGGKLSMINGGLIASNSNSTGAGGQINIAADSILIHGDPAIPITGITAQSTFSGTIVAGGPGGDINIRTRSLTVENNGTINTLSKGAGKPGNVSIVVDDLTITSAGKILAETQSEAPGGKIAVNCNNLLIAGLEGVQTGLLADTTDSTTGAGGTISVNAHSVNILPFGVISATTNGTGAGGDVFVTADAIRIDGGNALQFTGIGANSQSSNPHPMSGGDGGNIHIDANLLSVTNAGGIVVNTFTPGNAGQISIAAHQLILDGEQSTLGTGIYARSRNADTPGNAGSIAIATDSLLVTRSASVTTTAEGLGDGGSILINAQSAILSATGQIDATSVHSGKAGGIQLNFGALTMENAVIAASSIGTGIAGSVQIAAARDIRLTDSSLAVEAVHADGGDLHLSAGQSIIGDASSFTAQAASNGGSVILHATDLISLTSCNVTAAAGGNGGRIRLDPIYVILNSSDLSANAQFGSGGSIFVHALWYLPSADSNLTVSSVFGVAGNIAIDTPNPIVAASLSTPVVAVPEVDRLLLDACEVKFRNGGDSFLITPSDNPSVIPPLWTPLPLSAPSPHPTSAPGGKSP